VLRILTLVVVAGVAALAPPASSRPGRTVPCNEVIDHTRFPYVGSSQPQFRHRLVLDAVSVPPAYQQQVVPTHSKPWAYFRKQGLVVRASGESVTITVPETWRRRAAISWGYGGHGVFSSLRIAGCGSDPNAGNAYSGGFYLRASSACLPLVFRVGTRSATVRFGLGRHCT
jgi:hypothetical protein